MIGEFGSQRPMDVRNAFYAALYDELVKAKQAGQPVGGAVCTLLHQLLSNHQKPRLHEESAVLVPLQRVSAVLDVSRVQGACSGFLSLLHIQVCSPACSASYLAHLAQTSRTCLSLPPSFTCSSAVADYDTYSIYNTASNYPHNSQKPVPLPPAAPACNAAPGSV